MKKCLMIFALILVFFAFSASAETPIYSAADLFTSRDLQQTADVSEAVRYTVADGQDIHITEEGVYVLSGTASEVTVCVEAGSEDKVQLVLDGVSITNASAPAIRVETADKVFVTTSADSALTVTGTMAEEADGVIFSRADLVLNGTATLTVTSTASGIVCKDDLRVTGGAYAVTAAAKAIDANDSIRVAGGTLTLTAGTDGLHAENSDDDTQGYIVISGGDITITAGDDGVHATSVVQLDGGSLTVSAAEGIEGTYIQVNGGTIDIQSSDDGINAARKSSAYTPTVEINAGTVTVAMGGGDTDGIDSNSDIIINGGTISVTGSSAFDYDGSAQYNGGTIIVNGQQVDSIPNQMMGGFGGNSGMGGFGGNGGFGGGRGGRGGW